MFLSLCAFILSYFFVGLSFWSDWLFRKQKENEPKQARFSGRGGGVKIASGRGFAPGIKMLEKVSFLVQMWYKTSNKIA